MERLARFLPALRDVDPGAGGFGARPNLDSVFSNHRARRIPFVIGCRPAFSSRENVKVALSIACSAIFLRKRPAIDPAISRFGAFANNAFGESRSLFSALIHKNDTANDHGTRYDAAHHCAHHSAGHTPYATGSRANAATHPSTEGNGISPTRVRFVQRIIVRVLI